MIVLSCRVFSADCLLPRWLLPRQLICLFSYWWSVMISLPHSATLGSKDVFFVVLVKYQRLSFTVFSLRLLRFIVPVGFFAQGPGKCRHYCWSSEIEVFSTTTFTSYWSALFLNNAISHPPVYCPASIGDFFLLFWSTAVSILCLNCFNWKQCLYHW